MRNSESPSPTPSHASHNELWMVPYARNPFFDGRVEELLAISDMLNSEQNGTGGLALCGADGIGKTQLALEYAYLQRERYRAVFWVAAATRGTLNAAYNDIAELLDLPEQAEAEQHRIVEAVTRWLEVNSSWLLVLDDLCEPSLLKEFLPGSYTGHLLVTTRVSSSGKLARRLRVKPLTLEQSSHLLLRRCGLLRESADGAVAASEDDKAARDIAYQLNCQPLPLQLAGAYIAQTACGLRGYQERLRTLQAERSRSTTSSTEEASTPLLTVLRLSSTKAARTGSAAADLFSLCAFLAPDEIPESLLLACSSALPRQTRRLVSSGSRRSAVLTVFHQYALLVHDPTAQMLTIEQEMQSAWRALLPAGEDKVWAERVVQAIGTIFAALDVNDRAACQRLLPHAQVCAAHIERWKLVVVEGAWLLHHLGWYLHTRGQYAEAQLYEERALAIYRAVLGDEHASTAMILNNLAITYEDQGKLNDAAALHMQALAIRRSVLGENHPETAASLNNLALIYHDQGRLDDAASLYRQALAIRLQLLGETHLDVATLRADLAALYSEQEKFDEALALYQQALATRRKALGSRHPDTTALLSALAATYQAQGKFDESLHWYQQALTIQRKTLGYEHPNVATTLSAIAALYQTQERLDDATFWLQHALALTQPVQPAQAHALETLAIAYEEQEKHERAEALYQQALAIYRAAADESPLDIARCSYNLALLYHDHKRDAEARPLLEQALALWQEHRGANHPDTRKAREKYEQIGQKRTASSAKRSTQIEPRAAASERSTTGGLKSIARAIRRVRRKNP